MIDKKGARFTINKLKDWDDLDVHYCGVDPSGANAKGYVTESASNPEIGITLTTDYEDSFVPEPRPSL